MSAPAARLAAAVDSSPIAESAPEPRSSTSGSAGARRHRGELRERGLLGEADDPEVGLVDAQDHGRLGAERTLVVRHPGAVRRPDLDEPRSRAGEHVGDPEAVADLDQLAARDEHLAALGERGQGEHHGGGVVVHDERSLGAGDPLQQRREMVLARPAGTRVEVVLEIGIAPADLDDAVERGLRERRAAEVRVDQHPGCVEHAPQRRPAARRQLRERRLDEIAGIAAFPDLLPGAVERHACGRERQRMRHVGKPLVGQQAVDRRKRSQRGRHARSVGAHSRARATARATLRRAAPSADPAPARRRRARARRRSAPAGSRRPCS